MANSSNGYPAGTCPDSDHISQERSRLRQASQRHFAQSGKAQAAPPKQEQATGSPGNRKPAPAPSDLEDEM